MNNKLTYLILVSIAIFLNCISEAILYNNDYLEKRNKPFVKTRYRKSVNKHFSAYVKEYFYTRHGNYYTLIIDLNRLVPYHINALKNPDRLYIDFKKAQINKGVQHKKINTGILKSIRTGQHPKDNARIVLDLTEEVEYRTKTDEKFNRVFISFNSKKQNKFHNNDIFHTKYTNKQKKAPEINTYDDPILPNKSEPTLAQELGLKLHTIIIDPGHGGKDPGAVSSGGVKEKNITLDVSLRLKKLLEKDQNFDALVTRETDVFIPLEERTKFANDNNGDLFISIHVNAHNNPTKHGIETYYLSLTKDKEARQVASNENRYTRKNYSDLNALLMKIMNNSKIDESRCFAEIAQHNMLLRTNQVDRGVKKAGFVVLIGAKMPSILVEIAFLTNPEGERLVKSKFYRHMIAEALASSIKQYASSLLVLNRK